MKVTGIIRRIDDLGRIVIPKEIRRTMGISEGDPLELFIENNKVIFIKYNTELINDIDSLNIKVQNEETLSERDKKDIINKINEILEILRG